MNYIWSLHGFTILRRVSTWKWCRVLKHRQGGRPYKWCLTNGAFQLYKIRMAVQGFFLMQARVSPQMAYRAKTKLTAYSNIFLMPFCTFFFNVSTNFSRFYNIPCIYVNSCTFVVACDISFFLNFRNLQDCRQSKTWMNDNSNNRTNL